MDCEPQVSFAWIHSDSKIEITIQKTNILKNKLHTKCTYPCKITLSHNRLYEMGFCSETASRQYKELTVFI